MTLTIFDQLEQGTDEWLQARAGILTASTIGKLITAKTIKPAMNDTARGLYSTLITERITGRVDPVFPNRAMERGTLLEGEARRLYSELAGVEVEQIGFARRDEATFSIGASPDGLLGEGGGLEIKCPTPKTHIQTVLTGEIPAYNMAQVQASMFVTGRNYWEFVSYLPGEPLFVTCSWPEDRWQNAIREAAEAFESIAQAHVAEYKRNTYGLPATEWWDPLDTGEEIY